MTEDVMKTEGHTPTPWHITACMDVWIEHSQPLTEADKDFNGIAHCGDIGWPNALAKQAEWEANAHLIVTAVNEREALLKCEEALRACRERFAEYAASHTMKGADQKAQRNHAMVDLIDDALTLLDEARHGK